MPLYIMDTLIGVLNTISDKPALVIPVVIIAAILVTAYILLNNKKDVLIQRITHKRNVWSSLILAFVFFVLLLVMIDRNHFHITIASCDRKQ